MEALTESPSALATEVMNRGVSQLSGVVSEIKARYEAATERLNAFQEKKKKG